MSVKQILYTYYFIMFSIQWYVFKLQNILEFQCRTLSRKLLHKFFFRNKISQKQNSGELQSLSMKRGQIIIGTVIRFLVVIRIFNFRTIPTCSRDQRSSIYYARFFRPNQIPLPPVRTFVTWRRHKMRIGSRPSSLQGVHNKWMTPRFKNTSFIQFKDQLAPRLSNYPIQGSISSQIIQLSNQRIN
jgi:hypothetical protein